MDDSALAGGRKTLVLAEQLRAYYATFAPAAIAGTLGPLLIAAMFWQVVPHWRIVVWWCSVAATMGVGSLLLRHRFLTSNRLPSDAQRWLRLGTLRAFVVALVYGSAGALLFSAESQTYQIILFAWMVAISALVSVETANHPWLYFATLPPMLGWFTLRAAFHADRTALILAVSALILLAYLLVGARKVNKLIVESLIARFANAELLEQLQAQMGIAEAARAEAEDANRAKSRFLAAASHDLRQPIHALGLFASAVRPHITTVDGHHIVDKIESSIGSTEVMFNALLDVSRLDAGILLPDIKAFAVGDLLARLVAEYSPRADAKSIRLRFRSTSRLVLSDPTLLERVIRNYLSNGIRYTQRGGVLIGTRVRDEQLRIEICDTGDGIPQEKFDEIFQEFCQLGNPERDKAKGLGLGLAIVKRIGELLSHPIEVKSKLGRGSTFSVSVPLATRNAQTATSASEIQYDDAVLVGTTILVIDDDRNVLEAAQILLKQWGCYALSAESASDALAKLREEDRAPDVILSDYRLRNGETGIDAIRKIQSVWGIMPAALITGDTAPDRLKEATASGYALLHKPLNPQRLKTVLCRMLVSNCINDSI